MALNFKTAAGALALSLGLATTGSAATLDFVAFAAGNERGVLDNTTLPIGGLNVTFSAKPDGTITVNDNQVAVDAVAYFDDVAGGPGGLGVCSTGLVTSGGKENQCQTPSDDNVSAGTGIGAESVTLSFDTMVDFFVTSFNDADHNSLNNNNTDTLLIGTNGAGFTQFTFASALGTTFSGINSITFGYGGDDPAMFYVGGATATPVPLPAAGLLLLGGFGGLGGLAALRRRKRAA